MSDPSRVLTDDADDVVAELARKYVSTCGREDGACALEVTGQNGKSVELIADPSGVAFWPATKTLLIADLHLEKASSFALRGQMLPPYDTAITLGRLAKVVAKWNPARVVALGDSFHDDGGPDRLNLPDRHAIAEMQRNRDWVWITGNHDPAPPGGLAGESVAEIEQDGLVLRHEPELGESPSEPAGEIAGHLHPKAGLSVKGKYIRRPCFAASETRMILPSFGAYTGGLSVFHQAFAGLFDGRRFNALLLGGEQVFRVSARKLG